MFFSDKWLFFVKSPSQKVIQLVKKFFVLMKRIDFYHFHKGLYLPKPDEYSQIPRKQYI